MKSSAKWTGATIMTEPCYIYLSSLAGTWLLEPRPNSEKLGTLSSWSNPRGDEARAIYIVVNKHGKCCYVGQTRPTGRTENVAAVRLGQHMKESSKRESWSSYWVIPLRPDTPNHAVDLLEKQIAVRLMIPLRHYPARRTPRRPPRPPKPMERWVPPPTRLGCDGEGRAPRTPSSLILGGAV